MFYFIDNVQKLSFSQNWTVQSASVTLKIRSRSSKYNQLFPTPRQRIYVCLVKIHPLVQKIECGKKSHLQSLWDGDLDKVFKILQLHCVTMMQCGSTKCSPTQYAPFSSILCTLHTQYAPLEHFVYPAYTICY